MFQLMSCLFTLSCIISKTFNGSPYARAVVEFGFGGKDFPVCVFGGKVFSPNASYLSGLSHAKRATYLQMMREDKHAN
jgi:TctA family transporter